MILAFSLALSFWMILSSVCFFIRLFFYPFCFYKLLFVIMETFLLKLEKEAAINSTYLSDKQQSNTNISQENDTLSISM